MSGLELSISLKEFKNSDAANTIAYKEYCSKEPVQQLGLGTFRGISELYDDIAQNSIKIDTYEMLKNRDNKIKALAHSAVSIFNDNDSLKKYLISRRCNTKISLGIAFYYEVKQKNTPKYSFSVSALQESIKNTTNILGYDEEVLPEFCEKYFNQTELKLIKIPKNELINYRECLIIHLAMLNNLLSPYIKLFTH